jgi:hypothetical protein
MARRGSEREGPTGVERTDGMVISLGCSRTHQVDRSKPLFRSAPQQRQDDGLGDPYLRILVTPEAPAELVMWEELVTGNVVLYTDPQRAPCLFLAHGNDLRGLGHGVFPEPVLLGVVQDGPPLIVPLKGIGNIQWQLTASEQHEDESSHR